MLCQNDKSPEIVKLSYSTQATITEYHRLDGLNSRHSFHSFLEAEKSKIKEHTVGGQKGEVRWQLPLEDEFSPAANPLSDGFCCGSAQCRSSAGEDRAPVIAGERPILLVPRSPSRATGQVIDA